MTDLINIFENEELSTVFMHRILNELILDFNENKKQIFKRVIYNHEESYISIVNVYNNTVEVHYDYETEDKFKNSYNLILYSSQITKENINKISIDILSIYNDLYNNNPFLEYCKSCNQPYRQKYSKSKLFNNYCEDCDASMFFILKKYSKNNIECNICYNSILEKTSNDKITDIKMLKVSCCKNKYMCEDCKNKLHKDCDCNCGQCEDEICPFCKKNLEVKSL